MKTVTRVALAGAFALCLATEAQAQSFGQPQIPTPVNPYPANPVATDGTPLPRGTNSGGLQTGRSAFVGPVGGLVDAGVGTAGSLVGTSVGLTRGAVDTGVGAVDGGLNTAGAVVR